MSTVDFAHHAVQQNHLVLNTYDWRSHFWLSFVLINDKTASNVRFEVMRHRTFVTPKRF
ncbi:MAG: hypothetical protein PUP90_06110 [Nostoc sp. S4]|nr:hypothetical protein [Nostoc sp. S4]